MSQRRHVAIIAAVASLLAIAPLTTVFESWGWLVTLSVIVIVLISGAAVTARALRAPSWAQPLITLGVLLLFLTSRFSGGHAIAGIIPTGGVFGHFNELLTRAGNDIQEVGVPAPSREALQFLTLLGVGVVACLVDLFAVTLRRPALAGLPMLAIYSVPVAVIDTGVPIVPFVLGAGGYLWLLVADNTDRVRRWGRRFSGDGKDIDAWEPSPMAAAGRRLGLAGLAIAVAIPLLIPGLSSGFLDKFGVINGGDGPGGSGSGRSGNSTVVNPITQLKGSLMRDRKIPMARVTSGDDGSATYLRLAVADKVTQAGFEPSSASSGSVKPLNAIPDPGLGLPADVKRKDRTATIEILELEARYLPVFARPKAVTLDTKKTKGKWEYDTRTSAIFTNSGNIRSGKYTVAYSDLTFPSDGLRKAPSLSPDDENMRLYSSVPANSYVANEVARLTSGQNTQYDKVMAIFNYFAKDNGFDYTLSTKEGTSGSDIENFLKNKKGYCEQYASSMAWMVRQAKFPARVATGFTVGDSDPLDPSNSKKRIVSNFNLHAWVEVYFAGYGWVVFDPTPSSNVTGSIVYPWAPDPNKPSTSPGTGQENQADPDEETDPNKGPKEKGEDISTAPIPAPSGPEAKPAQWPWYALGTLAVLLVLLVPAAARALRRRQRLSTRAGAAGDLAVARERAHAAWAEFLDLLADYKVSGETNETPRALAARLTGHRVGDRSFAGLLTGPAADGAALIATAEERARYARSPITPEGLEEAVAAVQAGLRAGAGRSTKLAATLFPPSTVEGWRLGLASAGYAILERGGRFQRRFAPSRLLRRAG
ncbi:transglutaminase TgpA family protein [Longispora albida]|uniref:transglutaminase TgpA family protein n=1 Tax=Longispora albida TaxID=203523 RepID=UPI00037F245D|nr:DUF3488 and transglutaminase-like domain-containing protein [Longispora albida]